MLIETINAIGSKVVGAISQAAEATGTGFSYLLATAKIESGLNPTVKAQTSSATGLFQFIEQTWLMTLKQSGAELGYGQQADAIEKTSSGRYVVSDPAKRAEILNLRKDPTANAAMAGALTRHNADRLRTRIGRDPTEGELYMAHFLGAGGASKLITAAARSPGQKAADLFPRAAAANPAIFYDKQGGARSTTGVYSLLASKLARAMPAQSTTQVAEARKTAPDQVAASAQRTAFIPAKRPASAPVQVAATAPDQDAASAQRAAFIPAKRPAPVQVAPTAAVQRVAMAPIQSTESRWDLLSPERVSGAAPKVQMPPLSAAVAPLMFAQSQDQIQTRTHSYAKPVVAAAPVTAEPAPTEPAPTTNTKVASGHQIFHDLFSTDGRGAISRAVSELWGVRSAGAAEATPAVALSLSGPPDDAGQPWPRRDPYRSPGPKS